VKQGTPNELIQGYSAARNAKRSGLNADDQRKSVELLRTGMSWPELVRCMPVAAAALDAWRPELERRAKLPAGQELPTGQDLWREERARQAALGGEPVKP